MEPPRGAGRVALPAETLRSWLQHRRKVAFATRLLRTVKSADWRAANRLVHPLQADGDLLAVSVLENEGGSGRSTVLWAGDARLRWAEHEANPVALCAFAFQDLVTDGSRGRVGVGAAVTVQADTDGVRAEVVRVTWTLLGHTWLEILQQLVSGPGPSECVVCSSLFQPDRPSRALNCSSACSQKAYRVREKLTAT